MRSECPAFQVRSGDVLLLSELTVAALEALLAVGTRIWANFVHENWVGFGCVDVSPSAMKRGNCSSVRCCGGSCKLDGGLRAGGWDCKRKTFVSNL